MHAAARLLLVCTAFVATGAQAQKIYKCPGPNGTSVYSQLPCAGAGGKQQELQLKGSVAATKTDDAEERKAKERQDAAKRQIEIEDAKCLASIDAMWREANDRIAAAQARIRALEYRTTKNSADPEEEVRAQEEIDGLNKDITLDRNTAIEREARTRRECAELRRAKEEAVAAEATALLELKAEDAPPEDTESQAQPSE